MTGRPTPACLGHAVHGLALPAVITDAGREHCRLWHTDLPI